MGWFGKKSKEMDMTIAALRMENQELKNLCNEKDDHFIALMSDALRHKSKLGGKYMADRKKYLNGK